MAFCFFRPPSFRRLGFAPLLAVAPPAVAPLVDLNHNGLSNVWEWTYNAYGIAPRADSGSAGLANWQAAGADPNPFDSHSCPYIIL